MIDFHNFKEFLNKPVEIEITCYEAGFIYPDNNILIGMNPDCYYFVSEKDTEDELYWHIKKSKDLDITVYLIETPK